MKKFVFDYSANIDTLTKLNKSLLIVVGNCFIKFCDISLKEDHCKCKIKKDFSDYSLIKILKLNKSQFICGYDEEILMKNI